VCFWHTFRGTGQDPFGEGTLVRPWELKGLSPLELAEERLYLAFDFMSRLGVEFWYFDRLSFVTFSNQHSTHDTPHPTLSIYRTFHDRDIAPVGKTLKETNENLDRLTDLALQLQKETGIRCLWGTQNLFSDPIYAWYGNCMGCIIL